MYRIALGVEYDGSQFHGWQRQTEVSSVQEVLEIALTKVAAEPIQVVCAGRTDKGVHASAQVVHFNTNALRPNKAWVFGSNALLPGSLRVLWAKPVTEAFNARRSALSRRYRYVIYNHRVRPSLFRQYVHWDYRPLDSQKMDQAAKYWLGEHDFTSFRAVQCQSPSPIRTLHSVKIARIEEEVVLEFRANAFLHHMVRNMVGVLLEIGAGEKPVEWAKTVLDCRDRRLGGVTAPGAGLYLVEVEYPEAFGLPQGNIGPWFLKLSKESVLK